VRGVKAGGLKGCPGVRERKGGVKKDRKGGKKGGDGINSGWRQWRRDGGGRE